MKRIILSLVIIALLFSIGCATTSPLATVVPTTLPTVTPSATPSISVDVETKMMNDTWISPAKVDVGNFHVGARAEYSIRIHNGNDENTQIEKIMVGTSVNETSGTISLKYPLANGDITQASITSDNSKDNLSVVSYSENDKGLTINGFEPNSSRIISIVYKAWTEFQVKYRVPNSTTSGYVKAPSEANGWVIITNTSPVLRPKETKDVLIALDVPENAVMPDKQWEFWISVVQGGQGEVQTELCERWDIQCR